MVTMTLGLIATTRFPGIIRDTGTAAAIATDGDLDARRERARTYLAAAS
ncbi:hypothetical protein ACTMTI_29215 [Nonomuraea sp. H19]